MRIEFGKPASVAVIKRAIEAGTENSRIGFVTFRDPTNPTVDLSCLCQHGVTGFILSYTIAERDGNELISVVIFPHYPFRLNGLTESEHGVLGAVTYLEKGYVKLSDGDDDVGSYLAKLCPEHATALDLFPEYIKQTNCITDEGYNVEPILKYLAQTGEPESLVDTMGFFLKISADEKDKLIAERDAMARQKLVNRHLEFALGKIQAEEPVAEPPARPKVWSEAFIGLAPSSILLGLHRSRIARRILQIDVLGMMQQWEYDVLTATLSFTTGESMRAEVLGTESKSSDSFLWSWANTGSRLPPLVTAFAERIRDRGAGRTVPELTDEAIPLDGSSVGQILSAFAIGELDLASFF